MRPLYSILNIKNLKNNLFIIRNLSKKKKIWFVVKANAYGHGIKNIYNYIYDKVDGFAVVTICEALYLRNLGFNGPILLLEGFFDYEELLICFKFNFIVVIHSYWQINLFNKINNQIDGLDIYIKLNYDLNRLGFEIKYIKDVYYTLKKNSLIKSISLIIHLAKINEYDLNFLYFKKIKNINFKNISILSSFGLLFNELKFINNWFRIGILLYGLSPTGDFNDIKKYNFKPVMNFKSKIISIRKVKSNIGVGYNHSYYTNKSTTIGIVACGYADGYPRQLSNKAFVIVNNIYKANIIGYISMDLMVIDLSNCNNIKIGSDIELWGENLYIDKIAKLSNTISYNLICNINHKRIIFKYI